MFKKVIPLAIAAVVAAWTVGCANDNRGGGGGGTTTSNERQTTTTSNERQGTMNERQGTQNTMNERQGAGTTTTGQARSNATMGDNMSSQGKKVAEAYSRMPWVHANVVARDWDRALDDLHYVRDHVDDLLRDADVPKDAKTGLALLKVDIAKLDASIRKHDTMASQQARALVDKFAMDLEKPAMTGWLGGHKGGGAGTGGTMHNPMKK